MNTIALAKVAQAYYDGLKAPSLAQGWDKYVATDGENSIFVKSDYEPKKGEAVFFLTVRNRKTCCTLYKEYRRFQLQEVGDKRWRVDDCEKGFAVIFREGHFNDDQDVVSPKQLPNNMTPTEVAAWASESMRTIADFMRTEHYHIAMVP